MSVSILKVPGDDASRIYVFEGKAFTFPHEAYEFTDRNDANKSGYFVAGSMLNNPRAISVTVMRSDMIDGYTRGSWDSVKIRLQEAFLWDSFVKDSSGNASKTTVAERFQQVLQAQYFNGDKALYISPNGTPTLDEKSFIVTVNRHIQQELEKAADTKEELTRRINEEGYRGSVFDTMKIDNGNVEAVSYRNGVLSYVFGSTCGGGSCRNGSTLATESGLEAKLRPVYPFVRQFVAQ